MRHVRHAAVALGLVLAATAPARADEAEARAIVEKAVKAHGGQEALAKFPAMTVRFKGTFHGMGAELPMTGEVITQGADQQKINVEVEAGGMKFRIAIVLNGDKGWTRFADQATQEMTKDEVAESREQGYAAWVVTLAPLTGKQFTLATIGEVKIDDRPALGVKVSSKGHRDVDLYFDKQTNLLIKTETMVKEEGSDREVLEETLLADYKEVQGTKQAMKFTTRRDGMPQPFDKGPFREVKLPAWVQDTTGVGYTLSA
jgi:predicted outer membrane protein